MIEPSLVDVAQLAALAAAVGYGAHVRRRAHRLEAGLREARLAALGTQLHAHFLLNALNTTAELVHHAPDTADRMLTALGQLLRRALRHDCRQEIPLAEELELLRSYVSVESVRYGDGLVIEWAVSPLALGARVPALLLQPLVENAVRHGIAPRRSGATRTPHGIVRITAEREGDTLRLLVSDDGVGLAAHDGPPLGHAGVGLSNVRERLRTLYGRHQQLAIASQYDHGTTVEVRLPWRSARRVARSA